jgi:hypothetical protein
LWLGWLKCEEYNDSLRNLQLYTEYWYRTYGLGSEAKELK